ncbi:TIGR02444 family protein [Kordiimonas sp.]|uniref:TIGR02444 family protein n=1 Tax=Kordiimonas sp. TaxID=1970157 RepID=UPI003A8ED949
MQVNPDQFWQFCNSVYSATGVKEACLEAQDLYGADINLIFVYLWYDYQGLLLSLPIREKLETVSAMWQREKLAPHRARRRDAKGTPIYESMLAAELGMEKDEQAALLAVIGENASVRNDTPTTEKTSNCAEYFSGLGAPFSLLKPLISDHYRKPHPTD